MLQTSIDPSLTEREGRAVWQAMHRDLTGKGLAAPAAGHALARLCALFALIAVALATAWSAAGWIGFALAAVALTFLLAQFAFVAHDAGHASIAREPAVNRIFGQLAMTLVTGLAFDEWIARHRAHHRFCQDETRDPDMAVGIVASLTIASARRKGGLGRFMTRHQAVHLWLLVLFFGHSQRHLSQAAALRDAGRHGVDVAMLVLHYALWFALPSVLLGVPLATALLVYLVPATLLGPYLAAIFWVNHVGMPLVEEPERFSFLEHQALTSRTLTGPPALDWLFGGLNYQIEHHLFPQVPARRLPALRAVVRSHFAAHGVPYNGMTWRAAAGAVAAHLRHVARAA